MKIGDRVVVAGSRDVGTITTRATCVHSGKPYAWLKFPERNGQRLVFLSDLSYLPVWWAKIDTVGEE